MKHSTIPSKTLAIGLASVLLLAKANAENVAVSPLGEFTSQMGVGDPATKGSAAYDLETQSYTLSGAGENMWFDREPSTYPPGLLTAGI